MSMYGATSNGGSTPAARPCPAQPKMYDAQPVSARNSCRKTMCRLLGPRMSFAHAHGDDDAGQERKRRDCPDRAALAEPICDDARDERADRVTGIAPQPIHADGARAHVRFDGVPDCRKERWIHERRAEAEQNRGTETTC